jgi:hypothetical protein
MAVKGRISLSSSSAGPENFTVEEVEVLPARGIRVFFRSLNGSSRSSRTGCGSPRKTGHACGGLEAALNVGRGRILVARRVTGHKETKRFSSDLHCPDCDITYQSRSQTSSPSILPSAPARLPRLRTHHRHRPGLVIPDEARPWRRVRCALAKRQLPGVSG